MPARWINYAAFEWFFGFPVQLLRGLLALFAGLSAAKAQAKSVNYRRNCLCRTGS